MKNIVILLVTCVIYIHALADQQLWAKFKDDHSKTYTNLAEEKHRFEVFQTNLRLIQAHNSRYAKGEVTYFQGINQFSDLTQEEFKDQYLMKTTPKTHSNEYLKLPMNDSLPESIDWRDKGVVLPVRNQNLHCASCWAFSSVGVVESQNAIKYGIKEELSPQELVDCAGSYGGHGCKGGYMEYGYEYMIDHGVALEIAYSYLAKDDVCRNQSTARARVKVTGYKLLEKDNEEALKQAVATHGPVAVGIISDYIQFYEGGIYNDILCAGVINHAVIVVGYGTEKNNDYWIVKNSWGATWGEKGYIKMSRNRNSQCGIANMPSYPIIQ